MKFPFLRTIRTHLLLLVLICILPALGIIIYSGLNRSYREIERAKSDALQVVKNFSYDHERAVESARQFLMTLAKVPDIQNLNLTQSNKLLGELLTQNPLYSTLFVVNAQGFVHASGRPLPHDPLPTVIADNPQLELLFQNLIGNAIKFQGNEPPRIHVSASRNGSGWIFSVRNNGIGIAPEYAERIFIIFQRFHSRKEFPGTGIGLAICKKIVERHGGHIWVESGVGKGATFYFTLPATKGEPLSHSVSKDDRIEING